MRRAVIASSVVLISMFVTGCGGGTEARVVKESATSSISTSTAASSVASSVTAVPSVPRESLRIPILVYHRIRDAGPFPKSTWSWKMSVTPSIFEKHLQWIADHGYTTIDLNTFAAIYRGQVPAPPKPIVITFDDNDMTQYELALPMLEARKQIGVFYLITNRLENEGVINAELALEMHRRGMDIESHTITHRVLTALPVEEIDREFIESKQSLEKILGKTVSHVAYPGTAHNTLVRERALAAGYITATVMDPRRATINDGFLQLPRIMMTDDSDLEALLP